MYPSTVFCRKCGHPNRPENRFCNRCGALVQPPTQPAFSGYPGPQLPVVPPGAFAQSPVAPNAFVSGSLVNSGPLPAGEVLQGRYQVIKELGRGGMGAIYLVQDLRFTSRTCALKEMLDYFANPQERQEAIDRFNREADTLANLNHANIPQVYDRFSERNRHYLVMEYVRGMDLEKLLREHMKRYGEPLSDLEVVGYAVQLCDVLDYLHNQNPSVVHRDIKPANMIITNEGRLKLVDFGIAKVFNPRGQGTGLGTQGYAAPEQYRGITEPRTELYAIGASMHHLLTGRDPQRETPFDYPSAQSLRPDLSETLSQAIARSLDPQLDGRYSSASEFRRVLTEMYPHTVVQGKNAKTSIHRVQGERTVSLSHQLGVGPFCPKCGNTLKAGARFCNKCGAQIQAQSSDGELLMPSGFMQLHEPMGSIELPGADGQLRQCTVVYVSRVGQSDYAFVVEGEPKDNALVSTYRVEEDDQGNWNLYEVDQSAKASVRECWATAMNAK